MKSFDALYYIKENKKRSLALIILIATVCICYLGGLYITAPSDNLLSSIEINKNYFVVYSTYNDENGKQIQEVHAEVKNLKSTGAYVDTNLSGLITINNIMNINLDFNPMYFKNSEDFSIFNHLLELMPTNFLLADGEILISDQLSKNLGLSVGDTLFMNNKSVDYLERDYVVAGISNNIGFTAYIVDSQKHFGSSFLVIRNAAEDIQAAQTMLAKDSSMLKTKFPAVIINDYETIHKDITDSFEAFNYIYYAIIVMLALVLSITIHATFVGAYEKRKYEFSLYKALGYSNQQCLLKIAKEILFINLCGLVLGSILLLLTVYFLNEFLLNASGIPLPYFKLEALLATLLCDGIIILPILFTRLRQLKKYNITEY